MASIDEAKRFLRGFKKASIEYDSLNKEYERHMSALYSPSTSNFSGGGGSGVPGDKLGDDVAAYVDYCRRLVEELKLYVQIRDDVRGVVRRMYEVNERWGLSLHYRYVDFMSPSLVAYEMDYADSSDERAVHRQALKYVADMYPALIERDLQLIDSLCIREER